MSMRLGDLLVLHGVLTESQRDAVLAEQALTGRPFGDLAERLFSIPQEAIERAWAEQYTQIAPTIDPRAEQADPRAIALLSRRQAWQFRLLPLRFDGLDVLICTTREHLARALRFTTWHLGHHAFFAIAEADALGEALVRHYPIAGLDAGIVAQGWTRAR